jgi:hypothetical protein
MKLVISSLAIVTSLLGVGACTMDDESPEVDLSTLELRSDFEVVIVEPDTARGPRLADRDLRAKGSPADLSFADDHFIGGASTARGASESADPRPTFAGQELESIAGLRTWRGYPVEQRDLPTYEGHELEPDADLPTFEGHELGSEADLPQQLDDPCMCTGEACLRDWVDSHIGCDVCAVFVCEGTMGPHACNSCN